ncbi:MAG: hypothetical protein A2418_02685 [Candidatus Brennerbacteria bacterium RIFOXYC1_FULL_41_11]|uniref:DNA recombination protein RmuC n=1 Tax=Candidatus Brennerbacteria bacterium RIFOXYD1_FULL_41_16 TaxID=1797529 RepID=A0A1G1XKV5_9BACT|nr:MAG: hypothetical protein UU61_C0003G0008 [Parcubacteria group bacterium GW2011_GWB1_41_4]OGY38803.1 MAG: hypothetical protein A2391_02440 [Candidatus Brennerbacteria bacterium RIFOXYB1_FULL_41_13]OGY39086.1 MAG: hypothetical protein A2418_02685 [Candidatus Brennerbacteria bacterium RIFOXYC1_FULL_41_11]OGY40240.1 MAG: hypothetical protein A2570_03070 [Candidatus Brennerbacteria bacterium RIFOXYD1_FULL_41_16]
MLCYELQAISYKLIFVDILIVITVVGFILLTMIFGAVVYFLLKKQQDETLQNQSIKGLQETISKMQVQMMEHMASQINAMRSSLDNSSQAVTKEARIFNEGIVQMREALKQVHEKVGTISSFQEIFKSPKLRGTWGEASLEHLLSQYYPKELYELQKMFSSGERADACVKLPDGKLIAIDSKFPFENFSKLEVVETDLEKEAIQKLFATDVKKHIDTIAQKYILPSENTLDYAIMYIPAEAVYYAIANPASKSVKEDLISYAWTKKIIVTSPNLFYLSLKTIEHWFRDVQVSKQTQEILKSFEKIRKDGEKLADDFRVLGKHIANSQSAYSGTEKRLGLMVDKVSRLTKGNLEEDNPLIPEEIQENKTSQ